MNFILLCINTILLLYCNMYFYTSIYLAQICKISAQIGTFFLVNFGTILTHLEDPGMLSQIYGIYTS